jgi:hypothetical protein
VPNSVISIRNPSGESTALTSCTRTPMSSLRMILFPPTVEIEEKPSASASGFPAITPVSGGANPVSAHVIITRLDENLYDRRSGKFRRDVGNVVETSQ